MDFYRIKEKSLKSGVIEVYPDFKVGRSKDLMVRGKSFYAIWDEERQLWSTDEYDVQRLVDQDLMKYREKILKRTDGVVRAKLMSDFSSKVWSEFRTYMNNISDNAHPLDNKLTFKNDKVKKDDYVSKKLSYPLEKSSIDAYDDIMSTLYSKEERSKLEWAIGAVISGDSKEIQKFLVLYGEAGTGKSTVLNIVQKLFQGYYTAFEAKALTSSSNAFSTEVFKNNPLVAIQHDGDLSRIEDNTKLNSIISHEEMTMNEKYKPSYMARVNCFLFMATNRPVKITDAKSGIIRRLIDVKPSGNTIPTKTYHTLMSQVDFELGGIAYHCLETYHSMGKNYYAGYRPLDMMFQTDVFFNFVESNFYVFKEQDGVTLTQAYDIYKRYCDEALIDFKLPRYKFREELKSYFKQFYDMTRVGGKQVRSYYETFLKEKFTKLNLLGKNEEHPSSLVLDQDVSLFDELYSEYPAQYATKKGIPRRKWESVKTKLGKLNTSKIHYVRLPEHHIVIDFDIKDRDSGEKSLEKNLEAASKWPPTYAEFSKSGKGVHLHYIYDGDTSKLSRIYDEEIEVKVFVGNSSLRRKLTKCNNIPISTINSGLPLKGDSKVINYDTVKSEKLLRNLILKSIHKEVHPNTKPNMDFIYKVLEDAYNSELVYDVKDLRPRVLAFANNSSNQSSYCVHLVSKMKFESEKEAEPYEKYDNDKLVFFDVEVFPNFFGIAYKFEGKEVVKMINPTSQEIEGLFDLKLIGFNNRRYDNHILYARYLGYTNKELYNLSQRIINGSRNGLFREAYNLSYADVYEFSSKKQNLKKWEIELGIHHQELGLKWDEDVPEELWEKVMDYCANDVIATEKVFYNRSQDFVARKIAAALSGLTVNDSTQRHTAKIIFGQDKYPQKKFVYTDLSEEFPGYTFDYGKSVYRGEEVGEGGYVYSEPGMYQNVGLYDISSQHPTTGEILNMFGPYTKNYVMLKDARLEIKHDNIDKGKKILAKILTNTSNISKKDALAKVDKILKDNDINLEELSYSLKIIINIVYGMTSAKFDNIFRDPRNKDNIMAKRGALFMVDLKHAVKEKGYTVIHIKTDSIKIANADDEIKKFIFEFGKKYGYTFEHEDTYEKICLVNDSVYIAKNKSGWNATGTQFAEPYVYKTLFSNEPIKFKDKCETKTVTTSLYLDFNEDLEEDEHNYHFVGKAGSFCPIKPGKGGGVLLREKEGKYNAATGSKGYRWLESEVVEKLHKEDDIDLEFYKEKVDKAVDKISKFGDFEWFIS